MDVWAGRTAQTAALEGARITIDGPGVQQTSTTDASGRHVFGGLPAGEYTVDAVLAGHVAPYPSRPFSLHSQGCAEVGAPLQVDRRVTGRITGADGLPAAGVMVEAVPVRPSRNLSVLMAIDSAKADGNGNYELRHLAAGYYYVGVAITSAPTVEAPYPRWFYPGTADPKAAAPLHLTEQPGTQRFDFALPAKLNDRAVKVTVLWPDGRPAEGANILIEDPQRSWLSTRIAGHTMAPERTTIQVMSGMAYRVAAAVTGREAFSSEAATIEPGEAPLTMSLVLTKKGYYLPRGPSPQLEDWRNGLGLR